MTTHTTPFKTKALYEYKSDFEEDLSFPAGQLIEVLTIEDEEWYSGTYTDSNGTTHSGLFPKNFVSEPIVESQPPVHETPVSSVPAPTPTATTTTASTKAEPQDEQLSEASETNEPELEEPVQKEDPPVASKTEEPEIVKSAPVKSFGSRASTFNSENSFPSPSNKINEGTASKKSYQGTSSYIPPSFKKESTQPKKLDLSHSSYVPPGLGVSRSSTKEFSDAPAPPPPVQEQNEPVEDEGPKLSLKERIQRLQKQQEEEAERQAAAALKKQQKKDHKAQQQQDGAARRASTSTVGSVDKPTQKTLDPQAQADESGIQTGSPLDSTQPITGSAEDAIEENLDEDYENAEQQTTLEKAQDKPIYNDEGADELTPEEKDINQGAVADEENDDDDEEEEDEEDSEEAKRAALRARMAKLAGAGGYGGMGGFNPFGGIPAVPAPSSKPKKTKAKEPEQQQQQVELPSAPIPILPFVGGSAPQIPEVLQRSQSTEEKSEVPASPEDHFEDAVEDTLTTHEAETEAEPADDDEDYGTNDDNVDDSLIPQKQVAPAEIDEEIKPSSEVTQDSENEGTETLADKLARVDLGSRNLQSESAIEGDDEQEKTNSDEEELFDENDVEEIKEVEAQTHSSDLKKSINFDPAAQSAHQSDYTTGYESDDDTQANINDSNEIHTKAQEQLSSQQEDASTPVIAQPSIPGSLAPPPPVPSSTAPPPVPSSVPAPPIPNIAAPVRAPPPPIPAAAPAPPVSASQDFETPKKSAPPPPPLQTNLENSTAFESPSFPTPPVPAGLNQASQAQESSFTPSGSIRRASTVGSIGSRSGVPPIPQSPVDSYASPTVPRGPSSISSQGQLSSPQFSAPYPPPQIPQPAGGSPIVGRSSFSEQIASSGGNIETADYDLSSGWWINDNQLPSSLQGKLGKELIFEVDKNAVSRRKGKTLILKDYYILNQDNSQIILNVSYESQDPEGTVSIKQTYEPAPKLVKSDLQRYSADFGSKVFQLATTLVNQSFNEPLVPYIFSKIPGILPPVGLRSYGATIYTNSNNQEVHQEEDFRPGDIVAINKGKFTVHKKLRQKSIVEVGNDGVPFAAVLTEFDLEKRKFRVIEVENGKVKHGSYKPADLKSGKIKVFRPVGRDFIGW